MYGICGIPLSIATDFDMQKKITNNYLVDTISFEGEGLRDRELVFEFYDKDGELLKFESIVVLTADKPVKWPTVTLSTPVDNLEEGQHVTLTIKLENGSVFSLSNEVRYLYHTHIGWSRGERKRWAIDPALKSQTMTDRYAVPDESLVLGLYVGTEISYGKFVKTIHDEQLIYRGSWADPIRILKH